MINRKLAMKALKLKNEEDLIIDIFKNVRDNIQIITLLDQINSLTEQLDLQTIYKKNKEFLYNNCNKIKRRFYYFRDENNFPRVTVCVLYNIETQTACRGLSLCSFDDSPVKAEGRDIAEGRAINAYVTMEDSEKIVQYHQTNEIINSITETKELIPFIYKSQYNMELTKFEKRLFNIEE